MSTVLEQEGAAAGKVQDEVIRGRANNTMVSRAAPVGMDERKFSNRNLQKASGTLQTLCCLIADMLVPEFSAVV